MKNLRKLNYKCGWLLAALVLQYLIQPFLRMFDSIDLPLIGTLSPARFQVVFYTLTLLAAIYVTSVGSRRVVVGTLLIMPALLAYWSGLLAPENPFVITITGVLMIIALSYTGFSLLIYIFQREYVDIDHIFSAISIYFLIGHAFAILYTILEANMPGSFSGLQEGPADSRLVYFSFVTLSTLGYGDITPVTSQARSFAAFESVTGVLYVAILISRLVGGFKGKVE